MKVLLFTLIAGLFFTGSVFAADCVVLLHGLGRTKYSMNSLEKELQKNGYLVVNNSYASRKAGIPELSAAVEKGIHECRIARGENIHFVTHSLGGILVRYYFQSHRVPDVKRVVMLGPPNRGSEIVDIFGSSRWFKAFTGPAGSQLGTRQDDIPKKLDVIPLEVGVIAGNKNMDPWFSRYLPKPNDGKVSVQSTKLTEMKDFIVLPNGHTFICSSKTAIIQVMHFIAHGRFDHSLSCP